VSRRSITRRALGWALLTLSLACVLPVAAQGRVEAPTLENVLAGFARMEALSAHFKEEKRMALLTVPLVSEGDLYYQKPRSLARHTRSPSPSSLVLLGDTLAFGDAQRKESMGVDAHPAVRVLVDTFVAVLAGDTAKLKAMANVQLERVGEHGFRILVAPKEANVLKLVKSMTFEGEGTVLTRMELVDANGDRSVTTFSEVHPRKRFAQDEEKRYFRIGG
jgi:outer membrane lipoprotein-sorting protein